MATVSFRTTDVRPDQCFEVWRATFTSVFGAVDIERTDQAGFYGALTSRRRAGLAFNEISYRGQNLRRTRSCVASLREDYFTLTRPSHGPWPIDHNGRAITLQPGRLYLFNQSTPYRSFDINGYDTLNVVIPTARLRERVPHLPQVFESDLSSIASRARVVSAYLDTLLAAIDEWDDEEAGFLVERLLDLVGFLVTDQGRGLESGDSSVRLAHRQRIVRYIEDHLRHDDLGPESIAAANGISLSYLYRLIRPTGRTLGELVRDARLQRCHDTLADPRHAGRTVAEIAYYWGFNHPAHFSRVFRACYGFTPSEARRTAAPR